MLHPAGELAICGIGVRPKLNHESASVLQFVHRRLRIAAAVSKVIKHRSCCGDVSVVDTRHTMTWSVWVRSKCGSRELLTNESKQAQKAPNRGSGPGMTAQIMGCNDYWMRRKGPTRFPKLRVLKAWIPAL